MSAQITDTTLNHVDTSTTFDTIEAAESSKTVYDIPAGDTLARLEVIRTIHDDIEETLADDAETQAEATARNIRLLSKKDAAVLAVAALLESTPLRVVQAKLHQVYGGKVSGGKPSKTIPAGDGDAFLKAAKAYNDARLFISNGVIPESWSRGKSQRAAIAEMLDDTDKAELAAEIEAKSKIAVSDTITRFFRDLTPKAAPLWMNTDRLSELAETILVNSDYILDQPDLKAEYSALAETIKTVLSQGS